MRGRREEEPAIPLNPTRVGHRYPTFTYEVSREKVREYALAAGFTDPRYRADPRDVAAADITVPPTFPACFTIARDGLLQDDPELGAHGNLLHGAQSYAYHRPIRVGDVLSCTPWIVDIQPRGRMDLLTLQVDCTDEAGAPVLESVTQLVYFNDDGVDA